MVGRLVQQQNIGVPEKCLGQEHTHLVTAVQFLHKLVMHLLGDSKACQKGSSLRFCLPAVHLGKLTLQGRCLYAVLLGKVLLCIYCILFHHNIVELLVAHDHGVHDCIFVKLEVVLLEHRHTLAGSDGHNAFAGLYLARQYF